MATPMFLMATDQTNTPQETKPETTKTRGRKSTKGANQKKPPQRGLGVAQLERLRLQERWKKMTEPHHFHCQPSFLTGPHGNVPLEYAAQCYGGAPAVANDCAGAVLGFDHAGFVFQGMGNGGFIGAGSGDPSVVGGMDPRFLVGSSLGTSRELSSMPKIPPYVSDNCEICFKKKRVNVGTIADMAPINSSDFLGLNIENHPISAGEFSSTAGIQGAEVKQIHRKVGRSVVGGSFLMEYEFFPAGKSGRGSHIKELELPTEASFAEVEGEASCITTNTATYGAVSGSPDALDLSLKLSF